MFKPDDLVIIHSKKFGLPNWHHRKLIIIKQKSITGAGLLTIRLAWRTSHVWWATALTRAGVPLFRFRACYRLCTSRLHALALAIAPHLPLATCLRLALAGAALRVLLKSFEARNSSALALTGSFIEVLGIIVAVCKRLVHTFAATGRIWCFLFRSVTVDVGWAFTLAGIVVVVSWGLALEAVFLILSDFEYQCSWRFSISIMSHDRQIVSSTPQIKLERKGFFRSRACSELSSIQVADKSVVYSNSDVSLCLRAVGVEDSLKGAIPRPCSRRRVHPDPLRAVAKEIGFGEKILVGKYGVVVGGIHHRSSGSTWPCNKFVWAYSHYEKEYNNVLKVACDSFAFISCHILDIHK